MCTTCISCGVHLIVTELDVAWHAVCQSQSKHDSISAWDNLEHAVHVDCNLTAILCLDPWNTAQGCLDKFVTVAEADRVLMSSRIPQ
jgi:hypothetical protein